jgi:predicted ATPase/transcriptional regulator with XRE-family HTH domain
MTADHGAEQGGAGFDELLRRRRRAAGLTQADLAVRAGIGIRTVRDLERGRSSRPQRTTVELLATALDLDGSTRAEFLAAARGQSPLADPPAPPPARRLPAPIELVGRDGDVADLVALLGGADSGPPGAVTLVGLAGVGKTSLALAVAHRVADRHPGGVAGIVVTEVSTGSDILASIATVFGVGRATELGARLAAAPALVLVDAVERAPDAVAEALHWLAVAAPDLRVLGTGRHPIGLAGEHVWPVAPLEVPPPDAHASLAEVLRFPAVALFLTRLRQVRRAPPGADEVAALVHLVRRLGGLPLALELAAARGRLLDLNEILDRYGDRVLDLARAPAARETVVTLRDAVAASYRLLEPHERYGLRRLSVFRNRWSVELAEQLLADGSGGAGATGHAADDHGRVTAGTHGHVAADGYGRVDPVPLLDRLLELGLLSVRGSGPFRFRLLDVVRDFAAERAAAHGELAAVRRRHAEIFAGLAARTAPELVGANLPVATARLDEVSSDLWAALAHAANDDPHTALRLAAALPRWWRFRGRDVVGRQWLRRLLDDPRTVDADPVVRSWAKVGVAQLALEHSAGAEELPAAEAALAEFEHLDDVAGALAARSLLCALWMTTGGYDEARRHGEQALALAGRTGRIRDMAVAQNNLTWHEIRVGDLRAARRRLAAVDRLAAQCGEHRLRALALANLAEVARLDGRYDEAASLGRRAAAALEEVGDPGHRRRVLATVGLALAAAGRLDEAGGALAELRAQGAGQPRPAGAGPGPEDGAGAIVEAAIALRRDERERAAEWFAVAARAYDGGHDLRDVVEALVGWLASTDDDEQRAALLHRLILVCRTGGISLLPRERALIGRDIDLSGPQQRPSTGTSMDNRHRPSH